MDRNSARWFFILMPVLVFWIVASIDKLGVSVIVTNPGFLQDMGLLGNPAAIGLLGTVFSVTYGSCSYFWGFIVDRIGPRWAAIGAATIWGVTMIIGGLAGSYGMVLASRLLLGVGEGALYAVSNKFVGNWFERRQRGRAQAMWVLGGPLGPVIGVPMLVAAMALWSWRGAFFLLAALSLLLVVPLILFLTRDSPEGGVAAATAPAAEREVGAAAIVGVPKSFGEMVGLFRFWAIVAAFLMGSFGFSGLAFWLPSYLRTERHFPTEVMAGWASMSWLLAVIAVIITGWLADRTQRPALMGVVVCSIAAIALLVAALTGSPSLAAAMLAIGLAMINSESTLCQVLVLNICGPELVGRGAGIMTGTGNLIGGFSAVIIGWIVAMSAGSFIAGVLFLMACMALTAVAFSTIAFGHEITAGRRAAAIAA
jgi:MFS family permease